MAANQNFYTECVKACQSECASPGGGEITEERHGAAGCQSKDLYRAVAAAETDIGRHGMHDKSWWTGGTRLKKQENTLNGVVGWERRGAPIRDSPSMSFKKQLIHESTSTSNKTHLFKIVL